MVTQAVAQSDENRTSPPGEAMRPAFAAPHAAERSRPASARLELTHFTKTGGPCTKIISLVEGEVKSDGSACWITEGRASRVRVGELEGSTPLAAVAGFLRDMGSEEALCLGRLADGVCDKPRVVTERRRKEQQKKPSQISRTQQFLEFTENEPALMLVDFDRKGMPPEVADRVDRAGGAWGVLVSVIPGLRTAGRISRASTSSGVYNPETGEQFPGSGGEHHYLPVADGSDIPRALNDLHDRVWLAGGGWYLLGAAGQLLERSLVDKTVGSSERLVFEGAPVMMPPLAQDKSFRQPVVTEGETIDTRTLIPPLSATERATINSLKEAARRKLKPEAMKARDRSDRELELRIAKEQDIDISTARRYVKARHEGKLMPSLFLEFDEDEIGTVTVGDVLDNPDRYLDETLADPLEGVSYGRCKAKIMQREDGSLFINSFAHGHAIYELVLDAESLRRLIEGAPSKSVVDVFVSNLPRARLEPDEKASLNRLIAQRANLGLPEIKARIKADEQARAKAEVERAASTKPVDKRIVFPVPALNAESAPVMEDVDEALSAVGGPEPPMRNSAGAFCEIRTRPLVGLHMLVSGDERDGDVADRIPAPEEPIIWELDIDSTQLAIENYIRFERTDRHGNISNVALPPPFVRAYRKYNPSRLPIVTGVVTAPLVTETGVLARPGLDRERQLFFSLDPMLIRTVPDPGSVSDEDAKEAYHFLANDWLVDVLADEQGKALIVASALTVLERPLLPERPAFIITAPQRGGGKTTLPNMISWGVLGRPASAANWPLSEEERQKTVFAHLRAGPAMLVWDNVLLGTAISSPAIEASLTMPTIAGRVLGLSEKGEAPATTIQFFTGNNIAPAGDMASRSFVIPLDVGRPDPENREFKHPDPYRWTLDHRGAILRALYKLLVWNLQRGADRSNAKTRFKQWWALCGAPIEALAGVDLARILTSRESEDPQVTALAMLLGSLRTQFGEQYFTAQEVKDFGDSSDISDRMPGQSIRGLLEEATSKPFPRHVVGAGPWGQRLGMIVGKPVAIDDSVLTLERLADSKRGHAYKIKIGSR